MALCWLSPVSLTGPGSAVSLSVTGSSCQSVSALLRTVSPLLRQECIYSMFWFLCQRQSLRNTAQVSIFLGAFPEKCNIWLLAQGSCAAPASPAAARSCDRPRKMLLWKFWWGRKEKQGLVSISVCKQFSRFLLPAIELSVWPVCLALFLSKLWKCCWKVMLSLLIFFPFFSFFFPFFIFCFCIGMLAGSKIQVRAERAGLPGAGVPGEAVGSMSSSAANPEVFAAAPFCAHCLLPGAWSSSP